MDTVISDEQARSASAKLDELRAVLNDVLFGQEQLVDTVIVGLLARGHILLEGLPGLGKTELVKGISKAVAMDVARVQFTPDLLPGDITGNPVLEEQDGKRTFVFQQGPIFANLVLADEINRASPKTQAALLEAMQEHRVTVMGQSHSLPDPFFVLATQNPIELEGTYPLPEAQLDRFLFKLQVQHGSVEVLEKIVSKRQMGVEPVVAQTLSLEELREFSSLSRRVFLPAPVANFIARLVDGTHHSTNASSHIKYGASPRAALGLSAGARARALLHGRINASFEDVKELAADVMSHRVVIDYRSKLEGHTQRSVIADLVQEVRPLDKPEPSVLQEQPVN